ncbi:hypothetical protein VHP8226_00412 [Vibrio hippocampi]|uniref:Uncharacterized protein n=1 Tax=Vibrio hippocampi TaxID=654686 RepID=A0ABN8DE55_9VIBR|nr:hypothetical protein VHP8226_00412 [Vibrio hippocampi]
MKEEVSESFCIPPLFTLISIVIPALYNVTPALYNVIPVKAGTYSPQAPHSARFLPSRERRK